jgi:hypothetical protein
MARRAVNLWLQRVIGGQGNFGIDLTLSNDVKLAYREYFRFGTPQEDIKIANGILITDVNARGQRDDAASLLRSASFEIYETPRRTPPETCQR